MVHFYLSWGPALLLLRDEFVRNRLYFSNSRIGSDSAGGAISLFMVFIIHLQREILLQLILISPSIVSMRLLIVVVQVMVHCFMLHYLL